jgi:hypothetical protein
MKLPSSFRAIGSSIDRTAPETTTATRCVERLRPQAPERRRRCFEKYGSTPDSACDAAATSLVLSAVPFPRSCRRSLPTNPSTWAETELVHRFGSVSPSSAIERQCMRSQIVLAEPLTSISARIVQVPLCSFASAVAFAAASAVASDAASAAASDAASAAVTFLYSSVAISSALSLSASATVAVC